MPALFKRAGISFMYPDNWTVDEEYTSEDHQSVTVYSPAGGFWSVAMHNVGADPLKLSVAALEAMKVEYPSLEAEDVTETLAERDLIGFDLNFFLMDFTNTAQIRSFRCNQATYTIFFQADDLEFNQNQQVFKAMTVSLLNGLKDG